MTDLARVPGKDAQSPLTPKKKRWSGGNYERRPWQLWCVLRTTPGHVTIVAKGELVDPDGYAQAFRRELDVHDRRDAKAWAVDFLQRAWPLWRGGKTSVRQLQEMARR